MWLPDVVGREVWDRVISIILCWPDIALPQIWGKKPSPRCVYWLDDFGPSLSVRWLLLLLMMLLLLNVVVS